MNERKKRIITLNIVVLSKQGSTEIVIFITGTCNRYIPKEILDIVSKYKRPYFHLCINNKEDKDRETI